MAASAVTSQRRNIALIGHVGVGKTALAEAVLFSAGITTRIGKTTEGSSHLDFEPEEIKRGSTLKAAVFDFAHKDHFYTLLDTPGASSFIVDTACAVRAADLALLVVGASSGIKVQGEKGYNLAKKEGIAAAVFVNELDKERATVESGLAALKTALELDAIPAQIPIGAEENLKGVVDLLSGKAYLTDENGKTTVSDVPDDVREQFEQARTTLIESIAETDDTLLEKYLEGQTLETSDLVPAFKAALAAGTIIPAFCGCAQSSIGAVALLDAAEEYFPSPLERASYRMKNEDGELVDVAPDESEPFAGLVFKTFADPFAGQITLLRVVRGVLNSDDTVHNPNADTSERVGKLHQQQGKDNKVIDSAGPGGIVALAKLKSTITGHTLCSQDNPIQLEDIAFPEGCISFAVEPKSKGDEEKIVSAIEKISHEDPSIRVTRDPATSETIMSGMGQNHIDITLEKIKRKFGVDIIAHAPKIPFRETIMKQTEAQGRHKKQSGGRGQFGDCWLRIKPKPRGEGFEFHNEIFGGSIPRNYVPAVEKGVIEAMADGFLAGYPLVDIDCTVYDGSYHAVDSSDMAFKIAASKGFKIALESAKAVLLEPVMTTEVIVPDEVTGDVIGDLNGRRGKVLNMVPKGNNQIISAEVPLAEMLTYAPDLRSLTADRGSFHMEFRGYEPVPAHISEKIIKETKAAKEEENK